MHKARSAMLLSTILRRACRARHSRRGAATPNKCPTCSSMAAKNEVRCMLGTLTTNQKLTNVPTATDAIKTRLSQGLLCVQTQSPLLGQLGTSAS